jgi:hypothetical protein
MHDLRIGLHVQGELSVLLPVPLILALLARVPCRIFHFFYTLGQYQAGFIHLRASRMLHFVPSSTCFLVNDASGYGGFVAYLR